MIVKEKVHQLIIQTYYLLLKALNKYPTPRELASKTGEIVKGGAMQAGEAVRDGAEKAGEFVKEGYENISEHVDDAVQSGKEMATTAGERIGVVTSNGTEVVKNADDLASKEAGHLLGNAQEMLGGKIEDLGKGIKPEEE